MYQVLSIEHRGTISRSVETYVIPFQDDTAVEQFIYIRTVVYLV